jgi:hypothetical protein
MKRFVTLSKTVCLLGLLVAVGAPAWADQIYRWTDADGVVHFNQTPPPAGRPAERVVIEDSRPSDFDPEADIFGVAEQQARMQALREDMAERRAAALERKREAEARTPPPAQPEPPAWPAYRWPVFWPRPPRPQPPIAPPQRPPSVIVPRMAEEPQ